MRIGIFGGAFNPVHNGHISLAAQAVSMLSLDKLILVPTADPPHKSGTDFAPAKARLDMLSLAFKDFGNAVVSDIEFKRQGKSYTYYTVNQIAALYPGARLFLIIGQDQFVNFDSWYKWRNILNSVTLFAAARNENSKQIMIDSAKKIGISDYVLSDAPPVVVSSSEIRDHIICGKDACDLLPADVLKYIKEKGLYLD